MHAEPPTPDALPEDLRVTDYLQSWNRRPKDSLDRIIPLVTDELRRIAGSYLAREGSCHTLQATGLVHELYLRLLDRRSIHWRDRSHFFGFAARTMRRILVDHARGRNAEKRGGGAVHTVLDEALGLATDRPVDLLVLDEALEVLKTLDEEQHQIVELRFFAGLGNREIAEIQGVGTATVQRRWASARAWLFQYLRAR